MTDAREWVAVCFGALDLRCHDFGGPENELVVVPTVPSSPRFLYGAGADLWLRLVDGPVSDLALDETEREVVREMEAMSIASSDAEHPARIRAINAPWLESPLHELIYPLLLHVAASVDVEVVFIKGPTLQAQGLRERGHSGDVDCWVRPEAARRLALAMQRWGWTPAFSAFTGTDVLHSLTLRAGEWGSAIDVHTWFPGMAMDADDAFALLRAETELREFAGFAVRTPARSLHAVISALHEVRPIEGRLPDVTRIGAAAETLRRGGADVPRFARASNSVYALALPLRQAFPEAELDLSEAVVPKDWAWRLAGSPIRAYFEAIKLIPARYRARVIFRVLWPTPQTLRSGPSGDPTARVGTLRVRRALHGLRLMRTPKAGR